MFVFKAESTTDANMVIFMYCVYVCVCVGGGEGVLTGKRISIIETFYLHNVALKNIGQMTKKSRPGRT